MVHILRVSTQFSPQSFAFSSDCKRSNFASFSNQKKFVCPARAAMSVAPLQTDEKTSTTALRPTVLCASANSVSLTHPKFKLLAGARHKTQLTALSVPNQLKGLCNSVATKTSNRSLFTQIRAVRHLEGSVLRTQNLRFAVVVARFNEFVTRRLLEGALDTFKKYAVNDKDIDVVWVPGSFEIGIVAEKLGKSGKYQAVLCIGAVIRGDTSHYDAVVNSAASGVLSAGLNSGVPCVFGVLTCDDMDQAVNRAGGKAGNKGSEAALTAIEMASLFEHHLSEL